MYFDSWKDSPAGKAIADQINDAIDEIDLKGNSKSYIKEMYFIDEIIDEAMDNIYDILIDSIDTLQVSIEDFVDSINENTEE